MKLISTQTDQKISFHKSIFHPLPTEGGLWMFDKITPFSCETIQKMKKMDFHTIAFTIFRHFDQEYEINDTDCINIIKYTFTFPIRVHSLKSKLQVCELFHGPSCSFKDFGICFLASISSYFLKTRKLKNPHQKITNEMHILTATSGDTGSAMVQAFYKKTNISCSVLFPKDGISPIQRLQMVTKPSIHAYEIDGTFDDCQSIIKKAFLDKELPTLSTVNSINIGRLIAQVFYYFYIYTQNPDTKTIIIPSGNAGNLTACCIAKQLGLPIQKIIVACNKNDSLVQFIKTGVITKRKAEKTISNAIDITKPSNLERIVFMYKQKYSDSYLEKMQEDLFGYTVSEKQTKQTIQSIYNEHSYIIDPHTAVAMNAYQQHIKVNPASKKDQTIIISTAHPIKFEKTIKELLPDCSIPIPDTVRELYDKPTFSKEVSAEYTVWKKEYMQQFELWV